MLLAAQLRSVGTTSYYFLKYLMGFELIMAAASAGVLAMLLSATMRAWIPRKALVGSLLAVLLATQAFGHFPKHEPQIWADDGLVPTFAPYSRSGIAGSLLAAQAAVPAGGGFTDAYVPLGRGGTPQLGLADVWFHALTESMSNDVLQASAPLLVFRDPTVEGVLPAIRGLLRRSPGVVLILDPRYVEPVRSRLHSVDLASRVVGWA